MAKEYKIPNPIPILMNKFHRKTHREINLVPDIKGETIKALKLRNFIFFLCIVVASASVGVVIFFGSIVGGQGLAIKGKNDAIEALSKKLSDYNDLSEYLTIKDQVGNINTLTNNKKLLSRTFNILSAMIPTGSADTIKISKLDIDLSEDIPSITMEAQANAGTEPDIDYRVLDAFQKSMKYLTFDYGSYVDKYNNEIPAYCIIDSGTDGATLKTSDNNYYGLWTIDGEGCEPVAELDENGNDVNRTNDYELEEYEGQKVVRIWRTPQYKDWYNEEEIEGIPMMTEDGQISNVAHFESKCINYRIELQEGRPVKLDDSNNTCKLVVSDEESEDSENSGIVISESSNGRNDNNSLVLRFIATITLNPEVYAFSNYHTIALPPSTRQNVTDSFIQVQSMFGKRATDCANNDVDCNSKTNLTGGN